MTSRRPTSDYSSVTEVRRMFAEQFLKRLQEKGLLDEAIVEELRRQIEETSHRVSPETIAKFLVDNGHLTRYQAVKLIGEVTALPSKGDSSKQAPSRDSGAAAEPAKPRRGTPDSKPAPAEDELSIADEDNLESEIVSLEEDGELGFLEETEDVVPLQDAEDAVTLELVEDVVPLEEVGGKLPAAAGLAPADPLFGGPLPGGPAGVSSDPLGLGRPTAAALGRPLGGAAAGPQRTSPINVWDSKLLLVGGAVFLLLLMAFIVLYVALTRGSASEMFQLAEDDYRAQSYSQAIAKYERFLKKFPKDDNASLARVRMGTARLRLDVEVASDPNQGLKTACEVLPQIEGEDAFVEARAELTSLLPDIAQGFAQLATKAETAAEKEKYVDLTKQAMELVNNASYIPTTLRRTQETRIAAILADIARVQRDIDQEKDRDKAVQEVEQAVAAGETTQAYAIRKALLKKYPGLETDETLLAATVAITAKERDLVTPEDAGLTSVQEAAPSASQHVVVLSNRTGKTAAGTDKQVAFVLARGAVYALDVATGRVLWRRFVGYETNFHPVPVSPQTGADAILVDARRHEVMRAEAATGKLVWRLPVGEPLSGVVVAAGRMMVSTREGRLLQLDPQTGNATGSVRLPQPLQVGVCSGDKRPQYYQVGEHSNLYVLSQDALECGEVYYLGHQSGTVATPPVMLLGYLFIAENAGTDYSMLHILATNASGLSLKPPSGQEPIRLRGNVVVPTVAFGRRLAVVTDRDVVHIYDVDASGSPPVNRVAAMEAASSAPMISFPLVDGGRLWIADRRFSKFEIQMARGQLDRRWVKNDGDAFLAPLQLFGGIVLHVRRPKGGSGVSVSAVTGDDGEPVWQTDLAAPTGAMQVDAPRNRVLSISAGGSLYNLRQEALDAGYIDKPAASVVAGLQAFSFTEAVDLGDGRLVLYDPQDRRRILLHNPADSSRPLRIVQLKIPEAEAGTTPLTPLAGGLAAPLDNGQVALLDPATGNSLALPFQATLEPGARISWRRPAVVGADRRELVIVDEQHHAYRIGLKDKPQPHLAELASASLTMDFVGPLAAAGQTVYTVVRSNTGDIVVSLAASDLSVGKEWPMEGRATWGPAPIDGLVFLTSDKEGLLCFEAGPKHRWTSPLPYGPLAGPPIRWEGDFILAASSGVVWRIDGESGKELAKLEVEEPLGAGAVAFDGGPLLPRGSLLIPASSGAVHVLSPLPRQ